MLARLTGVKLNIEITKRLVYYQLKRLDRNYLWKASTVHNLGKIQDILLWPGTHWVCLLTPLFPPVMGGAKALVCPKKALCH